MTQTKNPRANTTAFRSLTKYNHKKAVAQAAVVYVPHTVKLQDSSEDKTKDKYKAATESKHSPVGATIMMTQKKPQPSADVTQKNQER